MRDRQQSTYAVDLSLAIVGTASGHVLNTKTIDPFHSFTLISEVAACQRRTNHCPRSTPDSRDPSDQLESWTGGVSQFTCSSRISVKCQSLGS